MTDQPTTFLTFCQCNWSHLIWIELNSKRKNAVVLNSGVVCCTKSICKVIISVYCVCLCCDLWVAVRLQHQQQCTHDGDTCQVSTAHTFEGRIKWTVIYALTNYWRRDYWIQQRLMNLRATYLLSAAAVVVAVAGPLLLPHHLQPGCRCQRPRCTSRYPHSSTGFVFRNHPCCRFPLTVCWRRY